MWNNLKTRLLTRMERSTGVRFHPLEDEILLGRRYHVIKGTIRKKVDYDDAWLLALGNEAKVVFDIGCNIGQSTILLLHPGKIEKIVLVDPNPEALSQAAENLIRNNLVEKAFFVGKLVSDKPSEIKEFFTIGAGAAGSIFSEFAQTASSLHSSFSVSTITIDILLKELNLVPDLVKIDVEGAEVLVLSGAVELAQLRKTRFCVEVHSGVNLKMVDNARQILEWCNNNRYRAWYLKDKSELINPDQVSDRGRCHLLLLPAESPFPVSLLPLKQSAGLESVHLVD